MTIKYGILYCKKYLSLLYPPDCTFLTAPSWLHLPDCTLLTAPSWLHPPDLTFMTSQEVRARVIDRLLGRLPGPEDLTGIMVYLASDEVSESSGPHRHHGVPSIGWGQWVQRTSPASWCTYHRMRSVSPEDLSVIMVCLASDEVRESREPHRHHLVPSIGWCQWVQRISPASWCA